MIVEKYFSENMENISVGIANINPETRNLEQNKNKIIKALEVFSEKKANLVIFPEYCLTGYFWENEKDCQTYMKNNCLDKLKDWLDKIVKTYLSETLQYIVFNGLKKNRKDSGKFFNVTLVLDQSNSYFNKNRTYIKTFLPELEEKYLLSGINDTLVLETKWGKFGFLTCWDIAFPKLARKLVKTKKIDALIVNAAWRKQGTIEYKTLNIKKTSYNKYLWDLILPAMAFQNQTWVMAANAVGPHSLAGIDYCGNSGIWAPSGVNILKASDSKEELLILHNINMMHEVKAEHKEYSF
ncbi:MAG: carbon-nitrogen hydrolase family protein [Desulfobacula sp.]|nr:carbon-nitrogen hydrolase family protein [Desulfobacula sp.]